MFRAMVLMMMVLVPSAAWAQWVPPDDRYKGYPRELVEWLKEMPSAADLQTCKDGEYYSAADTSIAKYADRVKIAGYRTLEHDECRFELTAHSDPKKRWRLVLRPKGTQIAIDPKGRDLFDFGAPGEKVCKNPTPYGWPILPPPTEEVVAPPIVVPPATPITTAIKTGNYTPAYVAPPRMPRAVVVDNKKKGGWFCSGKKGILCGLAAACVTGSIVQRTPFCGISTGDDDEPPPYQPPGGRPPSNPAPPPNTTPPKPGD